MALILPRKIRIRYLNVQHWNNDKHTALIAHLTEHSPEIITFTSTSRTREQGPIKIPFYNTFTTNKRNEAHAGVGIAIKIGIKFKLLNNFSYDTIAAEIDTAHGPLIIATSYSHQYQ